MSTTFLRSRWLAIALIALFGALITPAATAADKQTFHRFEVEGTANFTINEDCGDGTTAQRRVTVIGGHEEESTNGETTLDEDFVTILVRGFDCDFNFTSERLSGPAEFTYSPGLNHANVTADFTTEDGRTVSVDMTWEGVGGLETTSNTTTFPGFHGHFVGKERDAVATGTVVIDGETIVNGSTTNASIQSLEDTNTSDPEPESE
jgi:hypothetical protein